MKGQRGLWKAFFQNLARRKRQHPPACRQAYRKKGDVRAETSEARGAFDQAPMPICFKQGVKKTAISHHAQNRKGESRLKRRFIQSKLHIGNHRCQRLRRKPEGIEFSRLVHAPFARDDKPQNIA